MTELEAIRKRANAYCGLYIRLCKEGCAEYVDVFDIKATLGMLSRLAKKEGDKKLSKRLYKVSEYLNEVLAEM